MWIWKVKHMQSMRLCCYESHLDPAHPSKFCPSPWYTSQWVTYSNQIVTKVVDEGYSDRLMVIPWGPMEVSDPHRLQAKANEYTAFINQDAETCTPNWHALHWEERKKKGHTEERKKHTLCQHHHPLPCISSCSFVFQSFFETFHPLSPGHLHAWHLEASNCQAVLHQGIPHDDWSCPLLVLGIFPFHFHFLKVCVLICSIKHFGIHPSSILNQTVADWRRDWQQVLSLAKQLHTEWKVPLVLIP